MNLTEPFGLLTVAVRKVFRDFQIILQKKQNILVVT